jgi:hypothetical protein
MTEGRPPIRTAGGQTRPEQDTTAIPRIAAESSDSSAWSAPRRSGTDSVAGSSSADGGFGVLGSKNGAAIGTVTEPGAGSGSGSAQAKEPSAAKPPRSARARSATRQPRKARLTLSHINVYSVFKFSCVLAIALFFVWLIMVGVLYGVLDLAGVLDQINKAAARISGNDNQKDVVTGSIVFGGAIIIGAVYIVLFIAMSTIGSMVYNLCSDLVGGVELTLSERE